MGQKRQRRQKLGQQLDRGKKNTKTKRRKKIKTRNKNKRKS